MSAERPAFLNGPLYECDPTKVFSREGWSEDGALSESVTLPQAFDRRVELFGDKPVLKWKVTKEDADWTALTWREYREQVRQAARALAALGLQKHEAINVLAFNSHEWFKACFGAVFNGSMCAGIYITNNVQAVHYVMDHSKCKVVFIDNKMQLAKVLACRERGHHCKIVMWGAEIPAAEERPTDFYTWEDFMSLGAGTDGDAALDARLKEIKPGNACFLSYTSGTTGPPKAVMYSHDCVMYSFRHIFYDSSRKDLPDGKRLGEDERSVSYLPLSHIAGSSDMLGAVALPDHVHTCVHFAFPDALQGSLTVTLKDVKPTFLLCVPRVWEKVQAGLTAALSAKGLGDAIKAGKLGAALQVAGIPGAAILSQVGMDQVKYALTGAAPIQATTLDFFEQLGLLIYEIYGMTENTALSHCNTHAIRVPGSVGPPVWPGEVKLAEGTNEICTRSRALMMGYMYNEEKTKEAIDADGWLHTGDVGEVDEKGCCRIVGRIKELMISAGGENMAPVILEDALKAEMPAIANVMMVGDRQKFVSALFCLKQKPDGKGGFTGELDAEAVAVDPTCKTVADAKKSEVWLAYIEAGVESANKKCISRAQETKKWTILDTDFSPIDRPEGPAELTPTLKLKRSVVLEKYMDAIKGMYGDAFVEI